MKNPLVELDAILRAQRSDRLGSWPASDAHPPLKRLLWYCLGLGAVYGLFMGLYSVTMRGVDGAAQMLASTAKVPLLFLLTLFVTFPSMYVFSALAGSRLDVRRTLSLLLSAVVVTLALAASFAPILGFFTLSTSSYHFMVLLNVGFLACAGVVGCVCLSRSLARLLAQAAWSDAAAEAARAADSTRASQPPPNEGCAPSPHPPLNARDERPATTPSPASHHTGQLFHHAPPPDPASRIFQVWILLYGVVGAQMGWVLRPFIGSPDEPFTLFRERTGNVVQAIGGALLRLLGIETGR